MAAKNGTWEAYPATLVAKPYGRDLLSLVFRQSQKRCSRKPAQPRSYRPRIVRCYTPPIGPAPNVIHRASESFDSRKLRRHKRAGALRGSFAKSRWAWKGAPQGIGAARPFAP